MKKGFTIAAVGMLLAAGGAFGLRALPWHSRIDLWLVDESLPAHPMLASVWWNGDGTRAIAVGQSGCILERRSVIGDVGLPTWTRLDGGSHDDLLAVGGGNGPWRFLLGDEHTRVFAVGARGRIVDCTHSPCRVRIPPNPTGDSDLTRGLSPT